MDGSKSCSEIKLMISAYFDNELSNDESDIVANHLKICPECSKELDNIKKLSGILENSVSKLQYEYTELAPVIIDRMYNDNKITCNEVLEEVSAYYDGELNLKLHYLINEHLETCTGCKNEYIKIEKLSKCIKFSSQNVEEGKLWEKIEPKLDSLEICNEIQEKLSPYIDRELSKDELVDVNEHLLVCKYCRRDYKNLKVTRQKINEYFEKLEFNSDSDAAIVLSRLDKYNRKRIMGISLVTAAILSLIIWFSFMAVKPVTEQTYIDRTEILNQGNNAIVVNAEDILFNKTYSASALGLAGSIDNVKSDIPERILIKWDNLNLSAEQKKEIKILDIKWKRINSIFSSKLINDHQQLKLLIADPASSEDQIRKLQNKIFSEQKQFNSQALENFLAKKRLLDADQRKSLYIMLSK